MIVGVERYAKAMVWDALLRGGSVKAIAPIPLHEASRDLTTHFLSLFA